MTRHIEGIGNVPDDIPFESVEEMQANHIWQKMHVGALEELMYMFALIKSFEYLRLSESEKRQVKELHSAVLNLIDEWLNPDWIPPQEPSEPMPGAKHISSILRRKIFREKYDKLHQVPFKDLRLREEDTQHINRFNQGMAELWPQVKDKIVADLQAKQQKRNKPIEYTPIQPAPEDMCFPFFSKPVGPLFAMNEADLRKARMIRRRVMQMILADANKELSPDDKSSDSYHSYRLQLAYLRCQFDADFWLSLEDTQEFFDVMVIIAPDVMSLGPMMPPTEEECYEDEQKAIQQILNDPLFKGHVRFTDLDQMN